MANNLFEILKEVTGKNNNFIYDNNDSYPSFMINKYLSMDKRTIFFANEMNKNHFLRHRLQFDFYKYGIPKQKIFFKYVKNNKDKQIEEISAKLNIRQEVIKDYLKILE